MRTPPHHQDRNGRACAGGRRAARRARPGRCSPTATSARSAVTSTEIVRRIYVAIRDLDWNTLPGEISDLEIADGGEASDPVHPPAPAGDLDYQWHAEIDGEADGTIRYRMRGAALSAFPYAKIGICVHHPTDGYAGQPYRGSTPRRPGQRHAARRHRPADPPRRRHRPAAVRAGQRPRRDARVRRRGRFEFAGDLWEMEDQRNWTDASYKSASTPASLGYHHEAARRRRSSTRRSCHPRHPASRRAAPAGHPGRSAGVTISVGAADGPEFPPVGLRCADLAAAWSGRARAVLRAIGPAHLRADVHLAAASAGLRTNDWRPPARRAAELGCGLELAVFLPAGDTTAAARGRAGAANCGPPGRRSPGSWRSARPRSPARRPRSPRSGSALAEAGCAGVPLISGTNIYFNELNRHRIPPGRPPAWPGR